MKIQTKMLTVKSLSYLYTPSTSKIEPPLVTKNAELPIEKLTWEDFERLCLRLVQTQFSIDDCEIYGIQGQKQYGIDIFARNNKNRYSSYQCKKYKELKPKTLEDAVLEFKKGTWFGKSDKFVFCTSLALNTTQLQEKFEKLKDDLIKDKVSLIKWDSVQICRMLKEYSQIVYDFFGSEWVKAFIGEEALSKLINKKLDANQVITYRTKLYNVYKTVFAGHDPGIPYQLDNRISTNLRERFIIPDVEEEILQKEYSTNKQTSPTVDAEVQKRAVLSMPNKLNLVDYNHSEDNNNNNEQHTKVRLSIDKVLTRNNRNIILADPGMGKSTLLRFLTLDLLSDNPLLGNIAKKYGNKLPIWLPFAFITRNLEQDDTLSIPELLKKWFCSFDNQRLFEIVKDALDDERLLLIVDGIDEWTNKSAAELSISKIQIQADLTNSDVIYSSRPYGYRSLKDSLINVKELQLAPLSQEQQRQYIFYWFKYWAESNDLLDNEHTVKQETNSFIQELHKSADYKALSENPLMLNILIAQKLNNALLPNRKLDALITMTDYLISKHPVKRKVSASIIYEDKYDYNLEDIFSELAIYMQANCPEGIITKTDAEKVIEGTLIRLLGFNKPIAKKQSQNLLDIGANNIGIIIEKSNTEISFIHRQFQEFLAAKHLNDCDILESISTIESYANNPLWHQVFVNLFGLISNKNNAKFLQFISIIEQDKSTYSKFLRYELVLCLSNSPLTLAKESLDAIIFEIEYNTNEFEKKILWNILTNSLNNSKIGAEIREFLFLYFPNANGDRKDYRLLALRNLKLNLLTTIQKEFLVKSMINGSIDQRLDASYTIALFLKDIWLRDTIVKLLDKCINPDIIPHLLNCIISTKIDQKIKVKYFEKYKNAEHPDISLFVMKLKIHLKIQDNNDFTSFISIQRQVSYGLRDEALNIFIDGWCENESLLQACIQSVSRPKHMPIVIESTTAWKILFHCFYTKQEVVQLIIKEIETDKSPFGSFGSYDIFQHLKAYFTTNYEVISALDKWIEQQAFNEPQIAFASLVGKTDFAKNYMIENLPKSSVPHWYINALIEGWPTDSSVKDSLKSYFNHPPNSSMHLAAPLISVVFDDDKITGINILERILFNRDSYFRDRAVRPLIELDKKYFKTKVLKKFMKKELELLSKNDFGQYFNALYPIAEFFGDLKIVKDYIFSSLIREPLGIDILTRFYPNESKPIDLIIGQAQTLSFIYRTQLVVKLGEMTYYDSIIAERIALFADESNESLQLNAAIIYFKFLKAKEPGKILQISDRYINYRGIDFESKRLIAFSGYLISELFSEYLILLKKSEFKSPFPLFDFHSSSSKIEASFVQLCIDNFSYLISEVGKDFSAILNDRHVDHQNIWGFWARYSDQSSPTFSFIMDFIYENYESINNLDLIEFIYRIFPKSVMLRNIALKCLDESGESVYLLAAQILGEQFIDDPIVFQELIKGAAKIVDIPRIIALCIGWPNTPELLDIFKQVEGRSIEQNLAFHLMFLFRGNEHILGFFNKVIDNYNELKVYHRSFYKPMMTRFKKDTELQSEIKTQLLSTSSPSLKVSFYAILLSINKIDDDILSWKNDQEGLLINDEYGYNIITNQFTSLSALTNQVEY